MNHRYKTDTTIEHSHDILGVKLISIIWYLFVRQKCFVIENGKKNKKKIIYYYLEQASNNKFSLLSSNKTPTNCSKLYE